MPFHFNVKTAPAPSIVNLDGLRGGRVIHHLAFQVPFEHFDTFDRTAMSTWLDEIAFSGLVSGRKRYMIVRIGHYVSPSVDLTFARDASSKGWTRRDVLDIIRIAYQAWRTREREGDTNEFYLTQPLLTWSDVERDALAEANDRLKNDFGMTHDLPIPCSCYSDGMWLDGVDYDEEAKALIVAVGS